MWSPAGATSTAIPPWVAPAAGPTAGKSTPVAVPAGSIRTRPVPPGAVPATMNAPTGAIPGGHSRPGRHLEDTAIGSGASEPGRRGRPGRRSAPRTSQRPVGSKAARDVQADTPGPATSPSPPSSTEPAGGAPVGRSWRDGPAGVRPPAVRATSRGRSRSRRGDRRGRRRRPERSVGAYSRRPGWVSVVSVGPIDLRLADDAARRVDERPAVGGDVIRADRGQLGGDLARVRAVRVHQPDVPDAAAFGQERDLVLGARRLAAGRERPGPARGHLTRIAGPRRRSARARRCRSCAARAGSTG